MDKIEAILNRLPGYYDKSTASQVYNILKAFADEFDIAYVDYIKRADDDIGVENTVGDDLDWRWGKLINIKRQFNESDSTYRKRLMSATNALHGGTADSIQYAVAIFLGLADDEEKSNRCIKVYDGWDYPNPPDEDSTDYGNIICAFKLDPEDRDIYYDGIEDDIVNAIADVKAAGTILHVIVEFTRYQVLKGYTHQQLAEYTNKQIREWGVE